MGQSNIAAGATIGSNHNSRANDNEIQAGRGFWPGLCTSIKHSCRFASYTLLSKSDYPAELDIPLPFSLLNNNFSKDQLEIMPAFWWLYNMYALIRNSGKYAARDKRKHKIQNIEYEALAPDTVEEIFYACRLLEVWTAKAWLGKNGNSIEFKDENDLIKIGRELLSGIEDKTKDLEILGENMERSNRKVVIIKAHAAYNAYHDMLYYYAVKNLSTYFKSNPDADFTSMSKTLKGTRIVKWINFGGQLIPEKDVDKLRADISNKFTSWEEIHNRYNDLWKTYQLDKQKHALATLCKLLSTNKLSKEQWISALDKSVKIQKYVSEQVYVSRKKDFDNKFRQATFRNIDEMTAAIGTIEDNGFVQQVRKETKEYVKLVSEIKDRN